jgi:urease accessory protein
LRTDDLLVLNDGNLVEVVAAPEPLIEARAAGIAALARLAWHLGDRHVPVQVLPNRIRARRDGAIEGLLASLGAKVAAIEAPFEPEGGAYARHEESACDHHDHHHDHDHGHAHGHRHPHKHD